tara:strand:- start:1906 stop:2286 length:381 start_codon:yes stop_codon:yes gene_type:complete
MFSSHNIDPGLLQAVKDVMKKGTQTESDANDEKVVAARAVEISEEIKLDEKKAKLCKKCGEADCKCKEDDAEYDDEKMKESIDHPEYGVGTMIPGTETAEKADYMFEGEEGLAHIVEISKKSLAAT